MGLTVSRFKPMGEKKQKGKRQKKGGPMSKSRAQVEEVRVEPVPKEPRLPPPEREVPVPGTSAREVLPGRCSR